MAALPLDSNGWSILTKSPDTRVIYVSSSAGKTTNDGMSEAKPLKTVAAGLAKMRKGYPDWLLLKSGDVFAESLNIQKTGRSDKERAVIGVYGGLSRATISAPDVQTMVMVRGSNIAVTSLRVRPTKKSKTDPGFNPKQISTYGIDIGGKCHDILLEDCLIELFVGNLLIQFFDANLGDSVAPLADVVVRRNIILDAYEGNMQKSMGLYASRTNRCVIEENVFDHNGWYEGVAGKIVLAHNVYFSEHNGYSSFKGNVLSRPSSSGVQQRGGGLFTNNLCVDCPSAYAGGIGDPKPYVVGTVECTNNVILGGENNIVRNGWAIETRRARTMDAHHNIIAHKHPWVGGFPAFENYWNWTKGWLEGTTVPLQHNCKGKIHDNLVYNWFSGQLIDDLMLSDTTLEIYNNQIVLTDKTYDPVNRYPNCIWRQKGGGTLKFHDNKYETAENGTKFASLEQVMTSFVDWKTKTKDNSTLKSPPTYKAPPTLDDYAKSIGLKDYIALLGEMRKQSKANWRPQLTARVINDWFRKAVGMPLVDQPAPPPPPPQKPTLGKTFIFSTDTKKDLFELTSATRVYLSDISTNTLIRVDATNAVRVKFTLDGKDTLEGIVPYTASQDVSQLAEGDHTVKIIAYSDAAMTVASDPMVITFNIKRDHSAKIGKIFITSLDGDAPVDKIELTDLMTVYREDLPAKWALRADIIDAKQVGFIVANAGTWIVEGPPYLYLKDGYPLLVTNGACTMSIIASNEDTGTNWEEVKSLSIIFAQRTP